MNQMYDVGIVGAGCAGLACAMYAARLNLKSIVFGTSTNRELSVGGVITLTEIVENYPGFIRLSGIELAEKLEAHAKDYGDRVTIKDDEKVVDVFKETGCFTLKTESGDYSAKTVVFATGAMWRKLQMKGAREYESRGVFYCALCDGPLMKNKTVAVVGGSDTAAKEALFLAEHAEKVYIIYRGDHIRPEPVNAKRIEQNKKIEVITNANILEIKGSKFVEKILLDKPHNGTTEMAVQGVFGAIGSIPSSELAKKIGVATNEKGEIIINHEDSSTNVQGVFAAGDVADKEFKQAITGVAEGVTAAHSAYKYINENEFVCVFDDPNYLSKNNELKK